MYKTPDIPIASRLVLNALSVNMSSAVSSLQRSAAVRSELIISRLSDLTVRRLIGSAVN